jgi:hypothetical protein
MIRSRLAPFVVVVVAVIGCGGGEEALELPAPERFDWGGGQPIRFSPAPSDWRREKTTSGGLRGLRFVKSGSVGEGITMAEAYRFGDHDRCAEIAEMLARCDEIGHRELADRVRKSKIDVWHPLGESEAHWGEQINAAMDRAVGAAREGNPARVCTELEIARDQAALIDLTLDDLGQDDLVVFRTGGLVRADALTVIGSSRTKVSGLAAVRRDYTFEHGGHVFFGRELFVMHNNRLFVAHFHGLEENLPLFEGMISSIVFPAGECEH